MIAAHRKGIAAKFSMQLRKLVLEIDKYIGEAFRGDRERDNLVLGITPDTWDNSTLHRELRGTCRATPNPGLDGQVGCL